MLECAQHLDAMAPTSSGTSSTTDITDTDLYNDLSHSCCKRSAFAVTALTTTK